MILRLGLLASHGIPSGLFWQIIDESTLNVFVVSRQIPPPPFAPLAVFLKIVQFLIKPVSKVYYFAITLICLTAYLARLTFFLSSFKDSANICTVPITKNIYAQTAAFSGTTGFSFKINKNGHINKSTNPPPTETLPSN